MRTVLLGQRVCVVSELYMSCMVCRTLFTVYTGCICVLVVDEHLERAVQLIVCIQTVVLRPLTRVVLLNTVTKLVHGIA